MNSNIIETGFRTVLHMILSVSTTGSSSQKNGYLELFSDMLSFYRKHWGISADWAYEALVKQTEYPADQLRAAAIDAESRGLIHTAACLAESAASLNTEISLAISSAAYFRKSGNLKRSRTICQNLATESPDNQQILSEIFMCDVSERFWSQDYYDFFSKIHQSHQPRTYLEIGVATGKSLALARTETRALGIDPALAEQGGPIYHSPENRPQLYGMTSDDFFATLDVANEMGHPHFDVAFIDGLHHFDQVLRDFINLEKFAGPDSVILIHDCLPINTQVATRERTTAFWTGDVWKIIPCLKAIRPDLEIITLPLPPAGLALVRRLDPASRVLSRQYPTVVEQFDSIVLPESWSERCTMLGVERNEASFRLAEYFPVGGWL